MPPLERDIRAFAALHIRRARARRTLSSLSLALLVVLAGAGCGGGPGGPAIPLPPIEAPPGDGLLADPSLQAVVELQIRRDGEGLVALLDDPVPAVRARAALALASVQDPSAAPALEDLLSDPDPRVRSNAAFALGQLPIEDGGASLLAALRGESVPEVKRRIFGAMGKGAGQEVILEILALEPDPLTEVARVHALALGGVRGVRSDELMAFLGSQLTHDDVAVRLVAGEYFSRSQASLTWISVVDVVRAALDGYDRDEPTAAHLVTALSRFRNLEADRERLIGWLVDAEDWRVRATVAAAFRGAPWMEDVVVTDALFASLDDPSEHVAIAAASTLSISLWSVEDLPARAAQRLNGPVSQWRTQAVLASALGPLGFQELVVNWTRRMADVVPIAAREGIEALAGVEMPSAAALLLDLAGHPDPIVSTAATQSVVVRAMGGEIPSDRAFEALRAGLSRPETLPVARAAATLASIPFVPFGGPALVEQAFESRRGSGEAPPGLVPLIQAMTADNLPFLERLLDDPDYRLRRVAAARIGRLTQGVVDPARVRVPVPERPIDWAMLAELGDAPRVRIETDRGEMVARLLPEQAPATVQAFVEMVRSGAYDGNAFHRIVPNFVIQAGDTTMGDGTGGPGYQLPSEFTELPFERGVLGMASAGKDTEGSQFFIMHSRQAQLEGSYTAFGWLESGAEPLDSIQEGDRILRMTLLPGR